MECPSAQKPVAWWEVTKPGRQRRAGEWAGCARVRTDSVFYWAGGVENRELSGQRVAPVWSRFSQCGQGKVEGAQD